MKTVKILSIAILSSMVLFSCKDAEKPIPKTTETEDLALNENHLEPKNTSEYLYVTASTGLSLREYNNLQSNKLAVMPYGTKVKVITFEEKQSMNLAGIKGGMNEIEFNHKKGFAFNGFLSRYFPPERDISSKGYALELKEAFPSISFSEKVAGTISKPINVESLVLPSAKWQDAFFIAQKLYEFSSEFIFPNPKGKKHEIIKDQKPKKDVWLSQLEISRKDNLLSKIEYVYKTTKGFSKLITIEKDGDAMKISKTEKVE
ncbi:MAG: hypothetical protein ACWA45_02660 [Flavobacteriales bacterium]